MASISDRENIRYIIRSDAWDANLLILRKIDIVSVPRIQILYQEMQLLRTIYNVTVAYSLAYVDTLEDFFGGEGRTISEQRLAAVLASERLFVEAESSISKRISGRLESIGSVIGELEI